jgi:hypothetical protein
MCPVQALRRLQALYEVEAVKFQVWTSFWIKVPKHPQHWQRLQLRSD